jgi:hypothetical protein
MKEALEIDADNAASQPSKRLNRVYNCIESLSKQSKAALNGVILSSASWFDEKNYEKTKKKKKQFSRSGYSGSQSWKSVMNVGSAVRGVK